MTKVDVFGLMFVRVWDQELLGKVLCEQEAFAYAYLKFDSAFGSLELEFQIVIVKFGFIFNEF